MSNCKPHMLQLIIELHDSPEKNPKVSPETSFFMLLTVIYDGHEKCFNAIKPIHSKKAAIHKLPSPTTKKKVMRFTSSMNVYSEIIDELNVSMNPLFDLIDDKLKTFWINVPETLSRQAKTSNTKDVTLTLPNTNHSVFITVGSSWIGRSFFLLQMEKKRKLDVF